MERDRQNEPVVWSQAPPQVRALIDHYYPTGRPSLTRAQVASIEARLKYPSQMTRESLPMVCTGPACPYLPGCPLEAAGVAPIGKRCPFEARNISDWFTQYIKELKVRMDDFVEMNQVKELVLMDLVIQRAGAQLSTDGLTDENPVGIVGRPDQEPDVIYRRDPAALMDVITQAQNRKLMMLKAMLATRESRAKYGKKDDRNMAELLAKLSQRKRSKAPKDYDPKEARRQFAEYEVVSN